MKIMHALEACQNRQGESLVRSDSVSSTIFVHSVKSPPPKKIWQDTKPENIVLPDKMEILQIYEAQKVGVIVALQKYDESVGVVEKTKAEEVKSDTPSTDQRTHQKPRKPRLNK